MELPNRTSSLPYKMLRGLRSVPATVNPHQTRIYLTSTVRQPKPETDCSTDINSAHSPLLTQRNEFYEYRPVVIWICIQYDRDRRYGNSLDDIRVYPCHHCGRVHWRRADEYCDRHRLLLRISTTRGVHRYQWTSPHLSVKRSVP
jgi:hypothetical protein